MFAGRACYEVLCSNLSLPKAGTIRKPRTYIQQDFNNCKMSFFLIVNYINQNKQKIKEGALRCDELVSYLDKVGAQKKIWISEDASGIIKKVAYDASSNELVGIVLPFDTSTGMPIQFTYLARTVAEIKKHMENPLAQNVYIVAAQPIKPNTPPFILQIFGSDNVFTSSNVLKRWEYTKQKLKEYVIFFLQKKKQICDENERYVLYENYFVFEF